MQRPAKFVPPYDVPEIVVLAAVPGTMAPSTFGPTEVRFDLEDGRAWYVPQVIATEMYRNRVQAGQQLEVVKVGRKNTDLSIVPVGDAAEPPRQYRQAAAGTTPIVPAPYQTTAKAPATAEKPQAHFNDSADLSPIAAQFMAADKIAVDSLIEMQAYAKRLGLLIEIKCEDVRTRATTIMIGQQKGGY